MTQTTTMEEKIDTIYIEAKFMDMNQFRAAIFDLFQETIEQAMPEKKEGYDIDEARCKECGDYDDCDCSGYNEALDKIRTNLLKAIGKENTT